MKKFVIAAVVLLAGCGSVPPIDLQLELEALGGLVKVNPAITIGDGKVGPTGVEVIIDEEKLNGQ